MPDELSHKLSRMEQMIRFVAGVDEAGRGPLAGPVTAGCVVLPAGYANSSIKDSKQLSASQRERLFQEITTVALAYAVVSVGPRRIEELNIRAASLLAMRLSMERVMKELSEREKKSPLVRFLVDGNALPGTKWEEVAIIKGDTKEISISAASILAKVTRDRLMDLLDRRYPGYELALHKGYPTKRHALLLQAKGPSCIHRRTFAGVRELTIPPTNLVFNFS